MFYDTHHTLYQKTSVLYQMPLSTTNAVDYGVLTIHESNAPLSVARNQFRMMCDKDILQLFFEHLNQSMSPLKIICHYISPVTVSSSNRHAVCEAVCYQDMFCLDILTLEGGSNWLSQNVRIELPLYAAYNPRREQISKRAISVCLSIRKMPNGRI